MELGRKIQNEKGGKTIIKMSRKVIRNHTIKLSIQNLKPIVHTSVYKYAYIVYVKFSHMD